MMILNEREVYTWPKLEDPDWIRVLVLHPSSDFEDPLVCDLVPLRIAECKYPQHE